MRAPSRRAGGVTPFALSAVLILVSATLLAVYVSHRVVERERWERREGEFSLAEDRTEEALRQATEALREWMASVGERYSGDPERALLFMEEGGDEVFRNAAGAVGVVVEELDLNYSTGSSLINVTEDSINNERVEEVPLPVDDFYIASGTTTLAVSLTGGGVYRREEWVDVRCPRPGAYAELVQQRVYGGVEDIEGLLSYILTTMGELKVLEGSGVEEELPGSALGEEDVRNATCALLSLYVASRVSDISPGALEDMAYLITGRRGGAEKLGRLLDEARGGIVDPAAFYLNLTGLPPGWLDPSTLLAGALYAMADQLFLKFLEYAGILPALQKVVDFLQELKEDVMGALEKVSSFFKRYFGGEDNPSLKYLHRILVESASLEESYFLKLMVEDRSSSRYSTYKGETISSWPSVELSGYSGEEDLYVALTSSDPSTWIYEGEEVVGYTQRVYHISFSLEGEVEFPFQEVDLSDGEGVGDLLDYMEERETTSLSQLFLQFLRGLVEGVLKDPTLRSSLKPLLKPPSFDPLGDAPLELVFERAREVMVQLLEEAGKRREKVSEEAERILSALSGDLADVVSYFNDGYDQLVDRQGEIAWSSGEVLSALTSSQVSFEVLGVEEREVTSLQDSDLTVTGSFPSAPPPDTVLGVALNGGVLQRSISQEVLSWLEDAASEAYERVKEREVGEDPPGVLTQAIYSSFSTSSVSGLLDIFFGGSGVGESLLQMASAYSLRSLEESFNSLLSMNLTSGLYLPRGSSFSIVSEAEGYPPLKPVIVRLEGLQLEVDVGELRESGIHATDPGKTSLSPFSVRGTFRISARGEVRIAEISPARPRGSTVKRELSMNISGGYFFLGPYPMVGIPYASSRELGRDLWELIKDFFSYIWDKIEGPLKVLWGHVKKLLSRVMEYVMRVVEGCREVINLLYGVIDKITGLVKEMLQQLLEEASSAIGEHLMGSSGAVNLKVEVLSFQLLILARSPAEVPEGGYILNLSLIRGPLNTTFHLRKLPSNPAAPFISFRYHEGRSDLRALIDPLELEGPLYQLRGPLYVGDHGGYLELEGPQAVVYRRATIALSDILGIKPSLPIPPLGVVATVDLGVRMDYLLPPEKGVYLNEYGVREGVGGGGWVELYNPAGVSLEGYTLTAGGSVLRLSGDAAGGTALFPVFNLGGYLEEGDAVELRDLNGTLLDSVTITSAKGISRMVDGVGRWIEQGESRGESNSGGAESLKGLFVRIVVGAISDAWEESWERYGFSFRTLKEFASLSFRYVRERVLQAIEDLVLKVYFFFELFVKDATGSGGVGAVISLGVDGRGLSSLLEWLGRCIRGVLEKILGRPETSPPPQLPGEVLAGTWLTVGVAIEGSAGAVEKRPSRILLSISLNVPALKKLIRMAGTGGWEVKFGAVIPSLSEEEAEEWGVEKGEDEVADLYLMKGSFRSRAG